MADGMAFDADLRDAISTRLGDFPATPTPPEALRRAAVTVVRRHTRVTDVEEPVFAWR